MKIVVPACVVIAVTAAIAVSTGTNCFVVVSVFHDVDPERLAYPCEIAGIS